MPLELKIPTAGESITEVQIAEWLKSEGDFVAKDEYVVELETDKASMELPAPEAGLLTKILVQAGETANVGDVIAHIDTSAAPPDRTGGKSTAAAKKTNAEGLAASGSEDQTATGAPTATATNEARRVMPAARRVMAQEGLSVSDVAASGPGGRVLKEDALRAAQQKAAFAERGALAGGSAATPAAAGPREEEVVPMSMLRKRIAARLVEAQQNAAILTTFNEIDMTAVMKLRRERQDEFVSKYGIKLGFMSFFVKAAVDALKLVPNVNGEIRGTDIVYHNYFDIGVAVSSEKGLVVPVIRSAELLSFAQIELKIADLAQRARDRKLDVEELQGGTFTISNGGVFGSLLSTPILNPPQSGILGLHAIQERPVAIGGQVEIRPMMYVALSYDHRIIDGRESVTFLKRIKQCVEDPTRMLIEV